MILTHIVMFKFLAGATEAEAAPEPDRRFMRGFMRNIGKLMGT